MTVSELMALLEELPQDMQIEVFSPNGVTVGSIECVSIGTEGYNIGDPNKAYINI